MTTLKKVAHPLRNQWSLYFDSGAKGGESDGKGWSERMRRVSSVTSVEGFWQLLNNIKTPSILSNKMSYQFFCNDIEPEWEHSANQKGGRWVISVPQHSRKQLVDKYWLHTLLACIGQRLDVDNQICGVVLTVRRQQDKLSLWTRDAADEQAVMLIGKRLKAELSLTAPIAYQSHFSKKKDKKLYTL